jgi:hypothetical protein
MSFRMTKKTRSLSVLTLAALAASGTVSAIDAGGIAIHGSISATGAYSGDYDYYGDTADHFDVIAQELTLNGSYRFDNGLRAAAQIYSYELAGYDELTLDFASLDYSFNDYIGVRAGRNKLPMGLYGEAQDLDQIRTFASLPLDFYVRAARPFTAGYNGLGLYGNASLGKAGSLEYQLFGGWASNVKGEAPASKATAGLTAADHADLDTLVGGALVWNTPVEGLKLSATRVVVDVTIHTHLQTRAGLAATGFETPAPAQIDFFYGAGTWDNSGLFAGTKGTVINEGTIDVFSFEYTHDKWVAVGEYKRQTSDVKVSLPALGVNAVAEGKELSWYLQLTYQATEKLGVGAYYSQVDGDPDNLDARDDKYTSSNDLAVAASYALTSNWLIKLEAHALDGLARLSSAGDRNIGATDPTWNLFIVKTTFSF